MARTLAALVGLGLLALPSAASNAVAAWPAVEPGSLGVRRVLVRLAVGMGLEGDLQSFAAARDRRRSIAAAQRDLRRELHHRSRTSGASVARIAWHYRTIPFAAIEIDARELARLVASPLVTHVYEDAVVRLALAQTVPLVTAPAAWERGFDGSGSTVAVIDTGVDATHPFLAGKVIDEACFSSRSDCPGGASSAFGPGAAVPCEFAPRTCAHGTFVAGIAAGGTTQAPGGQGGTGVACGPGEVGRGGVAPGASLIAIRVFHRAGGATCAGAGEDPCAQARVSDIMAGLEYVYELRDRHRIAAVNLSLGFGAFASTDECDREGAPLKAIVDNLHAAGIAVVASSGNEGSTSTLSAPACISSVVSVGATDDGDAILPLSNSAPFLTLLAPGGDVCSTVPGGRSGTGTGTSAAAPHVAGALGILREARANAPLDTLVGALRTSGLPIRDPRNAVTTPRLRIAAALDALLATPQRRSGIRLTPDGKRVLVSKDVGAERWAIALESGAATMTGNVYRAGAAPEFVWCTRAAAGEATPGNIAFLCFVAEPCLASPCVATAWALADRVEIPLAFFLP